MYILSVQFAYVANRLPTQVGVWILERESPIRETHKPPRPILITLLPLRASWILDHGLAAETKQSVHEPVEACGTSRVAHRIGAHTWEVQVSDA